MCCTLLLMLDALPLSVCICRSYAAFITTGAGLLLAVVDGIGPRLIMLLASLGYF